MDPNNPITYFGETDARNKKIKFGIKAKDRLKHVYVIGKTGMGKSTLLENMAVQDIQNGQGLTFIDPHGGTAEKLLEYVPEHRIKDVLYFAPFDMEFPVSFNIMEDVGADKRHLVVNGLMSTFEKIWEDAWSARMAYILQNTLLALLEYPGATLLAVNRMYTDKEFRKKVVDNIKDISVKTFWTEEYAKYTDKYAQEATPAIQNKVGQFASNPLIRNIIGQSKSSFDIRKIMDEKKILIVNLSKGRVGEGNARLLGSMLITKIYLAAMSRADLGEAELNKSPNFYLYVDEFQSFANKSFADILSEARKYKLNLTIAHQYIEQMEEEVRDAVFGNVGTMITFRVGAFDAEVLEKEFAPVFTAEDLVNLGFAQIYLKLMIDGVSSQPFSATTLPPIAKMEITYKEQVIASSRAIFAQPRETVEAEVVKFHEPATPVAVPRPNTSPRQSFGPERELMPPRNYEQRNPPQPVPRNDIPRRQERPLVSVPPVNDPNKIAFAKVAEDLKKAQGNSPEAIVKKESNASLTKDLGLGPNASSRVSLSDLKPDYEKAKMPTKENVSSLKDALSAVLQKKPEPQTPRVEIHQENTTTTINVNQAPVSRPSEPQKSPENKNVTASPKEVPEDVLRKLLKVEEPK